MFSFYSFTKVYFSVSDAAGAVIRIFRLVSTLLYLPNNKSPKRNNFTNDR